jgi:polyferredoxin
MGSIIKRAKRIGRERLAAQIATLAFLNIPLIRLHTICAPVFYCHSCPLSSMACPIGVLVNFSTLRLVPFVTIGILGLVGMMGGRFVCGWLCPFGFLQDWLHKIPTKKFNLPYWFTYTKYALLVGLVFAVPFFLPNKPYTFCNFCPAGTLESTIPWAFMGVSSGLSKFLMRTAILVGVLVFMTLVSRGFCRGLCPLGAIFSFFNKFSLFRLQQTKEDCKDCGVCCEKCPMGIHPVKQMNTHECTRCLDCTTTGHLKIGAK